MTMAKAMTGGYMPAGGGDRPRGDLGRDRRFPDVHTFGGHAAAAGPR